MALVSASVRYMTQTPEPEQTAKERRIRRGWTLEELAVQCAAKGAETTPSTLSRIERGDQMPRPKLRKVLAELLELDVNDFEQAAS